MRLGGDGKPRIGQRSEDRRSWWDGEQWVPVRPVPPGQVTFGTIVGAIVTAFFIILAVLWLLSTVLGLGR